MIRLDILKGEGRKNKMKINKLLMDIVFCFVFFIFFGFLAFEVFGRLTYQVRTIMFIMFIINFYLLIKYSIKYHKTKKEKKIK